MEDRIKRFWIGNYKCGIDIEKLAIEDAGKWTCDIIFNDGTTETGEFILDNIMLTTTTTTTTTTSTTTTTTTTTTTSTTTEPKLESPSIGVMIGLIITIIFGILITIVVLAYFDIIKRFRFLPRRSPGLRQVDEMKRESDLRKRFRQSMHTFLDYVEKQTGSRS